MLVVIDNYDSFTYNLFQYLGELGAELKVFRNDKVTIQGIEQENPTGIVISPGPGRPDDGGISKEAIQHFGPKLPVLGVCLGHQCIGEVYGGKVVGAGRIMHGKTSKIQHENQGVFKDLSNPFEATRYHSLILEKASVPGVLEIQAETDQGEIMGVKHREFPTYGVQFHPESILTIEGKKLLNNFLYICKGKYDK